MRHPDFRRRTLHPTPPTQEVITFFFLYSPWCTCVAWPFVITSECLHNLGLQKLLLLSHCLCNPTPRSQTAASRHPPPLPPPPSRATVSRQAIFYISTLSEVLFTAVAFSLRCCWLDRELIKSVASFLNTEWQICSAVEPGSFGCLWHCLNDGMETKGLCMLGKKYVNSKQPALRSYSLRVLNRDFCSSEANKETKKLKTVARSQSSRAQQDRQCWNMVELFRERKYKIEMNKKKNASNKRNGTKAQVWVHLVEKF